MPNVISLQPTIVRYAVRRASENATRRVRHATFVIFGGRVLPSKCSVVKTSRAFQRVCSRQHHGWRHTRMLNVR